jgi:hypothetical protein
VTTTITVLSDDLHRIIADTLPFTAPDPHDYPALHAIHLQTAGGYLTARATDRYVIAWSRAQIDAPDGFAAFLPVPAVAAWLNTLKTFAGVPATIILTSGETEDKRYLTLRCGTADFVVPSLAVPDIQTAGLMGYLIDAAPADQRGAVIDPNRLAPFTAVAESRRPPKENGWYDDDVDRWFTPAQPVAQMVATIVRGLAAHSSSTTVPILRVTIGENFLGALMAINGRGGLWEDVTDHDGWRAIGGAVEAEVVSS